MAQNQMNPIIKNLFKKTTDFNENFHKNLKNVIHPKFVTKTQSTDLQPRRRFKPNMPGNSLHQTTNILSTSIKSSRSRMLNPSSPLHQKMTTKRFKPNVGDAISSNLTSSMTSSLHESNEIFRHPPSSPSLSYLSSNTDGLTSVSPLNSVSLELNRANLSSSNTSSTTNSLHLDKKIQNLSDELSESRLQTNDESVTSENASSPRHSKETDNELSSTY